MFNSIYFNGNEYKEMWLNGNKIWEKNSGGGEEIVYPYSDVDSVITYVNTSTSSISRQFRVVDITLPYSVNGESPALTGTDYIMVDFPANSTTTLKLINLQPNGSVASVNLIPIRFEQLRMPKATSIWYLFNYFGYADGYEYVWQPQYFEFGDGITDTRFMFGDAKFDELDLTKLKLNMSSVTNVQGMFQRCTAQTINISNFDLSSTTNVQNIFNRTSCENLIANNVKMGTTMEQMFGSSSGATNSPNFTSLDLSSWDVGKVTSMANAFRTNDKLTSLDVSNWNTSAVTKMNHMFYQCKNLSTIRGLNTWDISNVTTLYCMFYQCPFTSLENIKNWNTSSCTTMENMFYGCSSLTSLDLSLWDTSNCTSMGSMFNGCTSLKELDLRNFNTSKVTYYSNMFKGVSDCTIYVNENKWTLGISPALNGGTNLKFVILDDNGNVVPRPTGLTLDFTQPKMPLQLPVWIDEETRGSSYYFAHGTYVVDSSLYGLVNSGSNSSSSAYWICYKVVAPTTGSLEITFRAYASGSSYPFTIHSTSDAKQPSYSSSTNRIIRAYGTTYKNTDSVASIHVTQGETYYIHIQIRRGNTQYGACIRSIELIPSE